MSILSLKNAFQLLIKLGMFLVWSQWLTYCCTENHFQCFAMRKGACYWRTCAHRVSNGKQYIPFPPFAFWLINDGLALCVGAIAIDGSIVALLRANYGVCYICRKRRSSKACTKVLDRSSGIRHLIWGKIELWKSSWKCAVDEESCADRYFITIARVRDWAPQTLISRSTWDSDAVSAPSKRRYRCFVLRGLCQPLGVCSVVVLVASPSSSVLGDDSTPEHSLQGL